MNKQKATVAIGSNILASKDYISWVDGEYLKSIWTKILLHYQQYVADEIINLLCPVIKVGGGWIPF